MLQSGKIIVPRQGPEKSQILLLKRTIRLANCAIQLQHSPPHSPPQDWANSLANSATPTHHAAPILTSDSQGDQPRRGDSVGKGDDTPKQPELGAAPSPGPAFDSSLGRSPEEILGIGSCKPQPPECATTSRGSSSSPHHHPTGAASFDRPEPCEQTLQNRAAEFSLPLMVMRILALFGSLQSRRGLVRHSGAARFAPASNGVTAPGFNPCRPVSTRSPMSPPPTQVPGSTREIVPAFFPRLASGDDPPGHRP